MNGKCWYIFNGHLKYFRHIGCVLLNFVIFCGNLVNFLLFWYFVPRKSGNPGHQSGNLWNAVKNTLPSKQCDQIGRNFGIGEKSIQNFFTRRLKYFNHFCQIFNNQKLNHEIYVGLAVLNFLQQFWSLFPAIPVTFPKTFLAGESNFDRKMFLARKLVETG
jgi:hypothetical protein